MKKNLYASVAFGALLAMSAMPGCAQFENYAKADRETNMEFQEARDVFSPREIPAASENTASNGVPEFQDYTSTSLADMKSMPLVTISVNETIPLKDVLYELANQADYDIELDSRIQGAVIFSARNRPFDEVMARLSDMAGLRYTMKGDYVRVEIDNPYTETYKLNYLMMNRDSTTSISSGSDAGGGEGGETTSGSINTSSSFAINGSAKADYWADIESNIKSILANASNANSLSTAFTPQVQTAVVAQPSVVPPAAPDEIGGVPDAMPVTAPTVPVTATAPAPTSAATTPAPSGGDTPVAATGPSTYSLNRQAGLLTVYGNQRVQKAVKDYIDSVTRQVGAQVLIEAKILEVTLEDRYSTGINWQSLDLGGLLDNWSVTLPSISIPPSNNGSPDPGDGIGIGYSSGDISAIVSAVSKYGTVHALASPRLSVMNNQPAVLNVSRQLIYFEIDGGGTTTTDTSTETTEASATPVSVDIGIFMNVLPSIDVDNKEVTLSIRPTIRKDTGEVATNPLEPDNVIPLIASQEFDSVLKLRSGDVVVLGGLLDDQSDNTFTGVPMASEVPIFGNLFRGRVDATRKKELVVLLKATVLDRPQDSIDATDRDMYKTFARDRHPFAM